MSHLIVALMNQRNYEVLKNRPTALRPAKSICKNKLDLAGRGLGLSGSVVVLFFLLPQFIYSFAAIHSTRPMISRVPAPIGALPPGPWSSVSPCPSGGSGGFWAKKLNEIKRTKIALLP